MEEGNANSTGTPARNKTAYAGAAIVIIIVLAAAVLMFNSQKPSAQNKSTALSTVQAVSTAITGGTTTAPQANLTNSTPYNGVTLFAGSKYTSVSYLIYAPNQTNKTFQPTGFTVSVSKELGSEVNITFTRTGNFGTTTTFSVPNTDSVYYVDNQTAGNSSIQGVGVIVVNPSGYVTGPPTTP